ncbi:hypothetical protein ACFX2C_034895 [Malus domestica]
MYPSAWIRVWLKWPIQRPKGLQAKLPFCMSKFQIRRTGVKIVGVILLLQVWEEGCLRLDGIEGVGVDGSGNCRRLKTGGGGVNAAIFSAGGPALEVATKEQAHKGCKVLRECYTSLFEGFATIVRTQAKSPKGSFENLQTKLPESQVHLTVPLEIILQTSIKRLRYQDDTEDSNTGKPNMSNKSDGSRTKS